MIEIIKYNTTIIRKTVFNLILKKENIKSKDINIKTFKVIDLK